MTEPNKDATPADRPQQTPPQQPARPAANRPQSGGRPAQPRQAPPTGPAPASVPTERAGESVKGQAQKDEEAEREALGKEGALSGTNEPTPSGVQRESSGPAHQSPDPQVTTQGPRPGVGGGDVRKSHPFNPQMNPEGSLGDDPAGDQQQTPEEAARERAGGGAVFVVRKENLSGVTVPVGGFATVDDFPENADFDWLLKQGAIVYAEDMQADGPRAARMTEQHLAEIDELHDRAEELQEQLDKANKEIRSLKHELRKTRGVALVHRAKGGPRQTVAAGQSDNTDYSE